MQLGLPRRRGRHLAGDIGNLGLTWDRHEGGKLCVSVRSGNGLVALGTFTMSARVESGTLQSSSDPDPRLILVEAGPHRLVVRAVQRLYDDAGVHLGDAMQETWAWADGSVFLNAMLRLVHSRRGGRLLAAEARFAIGGGWTAAHDGDLRLEHDSGMRAAATCYRDGEPWAQPIDGAEPAPGDARCIWEVLEGGGPPYYRYWGPYYDQWGGTPGWRDLRLDDGVLHAVWAEGEPQERTPTQGFQGTLALHTASNEAELERRLRAFHSPLSPSIDGGQVLGHVVMDGSTMVRQTAAGMKVSFPPDPERRTARLHVRGLASRSVVHVAGADAPVVLPLADGDLADDPNGPNLLRPDDRHGPILTDPDRPPDELVTTVPLAAARATEVELVSTPGLWLASRRWDERQEMLLFSSAQPGGSLGAFSLRDLKMRDLKVPGDRESTMARLPLYWFLANASSTHHCLNDPVSVDLLDNGPEAVRFRVVARNPAGTAESDVEVTIPFETDRLRIELACRFHAIADWDVAAIQYCNFFPEEHRYPGEWGSDRVLVMAADGQRMLIDHQGSGDRRLLDGETLHGHQGNLFVALYGGPRASILALSRPRAIDGGTADYALCGCWLDNHLNVTAQSDTIPAGTRWHVDLTLVLTQTTNIDDDLRALGARALETGTLP